MEVFDPKEKRNKNSWTRHASTVSRSSYNIQNDHYQQLSFSDMTFSGFGSGSGES